MSEAEKTAQKWISYDHQKGANMRLRATFNSVDLLDAVMQAKQETWDLCHSDAPCGHARANWRDPKYGTPEYKGEERCEMCAKDATIARLELSEKEKESRIDAYVKLSEQDAATIASLREEVERLKNAAEVYLRCGTREYQTVKEDRDQLRARVEELENANAEGGNQLQRLCEEIAELKHLNLCTTCAYCGEFFEADADGRKVDALQAHMKICEKHPMRELERELASAKEHMGTLRELKEGYQKELEAERGRVK